MRFSATPITVLTGFLGAGKTTFLNQLLRQPGGRRFAIIENEYGEVGIDSELIERTADEAIVQLDNGCVCCTVRGDLANALHRLARERDSGSIAFDHVVIETTGLADPGPIARTFMAETALLEHFYLDGVVTLIDAVVGARMLAQRREARAQIAYADRIVITKCDIAAAREIAALQEKVAGMNRLARVTRGDGLEEDLDLLNDLLQIKGFQWDNAPIRLTDESASTCDHGHAHCAGDHENERHQDHLESVSCLLWQSDGPVDPDLFDQVMATLGDIYPESLWRVKGVLNIAGSRQRVVVQGASGLLQMNSTTYWRPFEPRVSRLVLIGEKLDVSAIRAMLDGCVLRGPAGRQ